MPRRKSKQGGDRPALRGWDIGFRNGGRRTWMGSYLLTLCSWTWRNRSCDNICPAGSNLDIWGHGTELPMTLSGHVTDTLTGKQRLGWTWGEPGKARAEGAQAPPRHLLRDLEPQEEAVRTELAGSRNTERGPMAGARRGKTQRPHAQPHAGPGVTEHEAAPGPSLAGPLNTNPRSGAPAPEAPPPRPRFLLICSSPGGS